MSEFTGRRCVVTGAASGIGHAVAEKLLAAAKVHEFTTNLVVTRRHDAADGVVALDLVDAQGAICRPGSPGRTSTYCSTKDWSVSIPCAVIHAMRRPGESASCLTPTAGAAHAMFTTICPRAAACESAARATIFRSSTHRDICSSRVGSGSPRSSR